MENSLKGLMLAAGIIITCIIISLGFYIAREASDTASSGTGQINELQQNLPTHPRRCTKIPRCPAVRSSM